tara:strand:- start:118 stop:555 length:438 start_codon:yes stop_codon:yes gene_type:complete
MRDNTLKYKILKEHNLIVDYYEGVFSVEDIIRHKENQSKDPMWDSAYSTIADMRHMSFTSPLSESIKLADYVSDHPKWAHPRKSAQITNLSNQMVFKTIYKDLVDKFTNIKIKPFNDISEALNWLDLGPISIEKIEAIMTELKES